MTLVRWLAAGAATLSVAVSVWAQYKPGSYYAEPVTPPQVQVSPNYYTRPAMPPQANPKPSQGISDNVLIGHGVNHYGEVYAPSSIILRAQSDGSLQATQRYDGRRSHENDELMKTAWHLVHNGNLRGAQILAEHVLRADSSNPGAREILGITTREEIRSEPARRVIFAPPTCLPYDGPCPAEQTILKPGIFEPCTVSGNQGTCNPGPCSQGTCCQERCEGVIFADKILSKDCACKECECKDKCACKPTSASFAPAHPQGSRVETIIPVKIGTGAISVIPMKVSITVTPAVVHQGLPATVFCPLLPPPLPSLTLSPMMPFCGQPVSHPIFNHPVAFTPNGPIALPVPPIPPQCPLPCPMPSTQAVKVSEPCPREVNATSTLPADVKISVKAGRMYLSSPALEAACDSLQVLECGKVRLEGKVEVTFKKGQKPATVQAERVTVGLTTGEFAVTTAPAGMFTPALHPVSYWQRVDKPETPATLTPAGQKYPPKRTYEGEAGSSAWMSRILPAVPATRR